MVYYTTLFNVIFANNLFIFIKKNTEFQSRLGEIADGRWQGGREYFLNHVNLLSSLKIK